ncbi:alpha-ketoglutarate-dependent sulfonate dioxygenase [Bisporella sp. PMI_857]|nr:alpha-ketoglutarate-dependent sulfonate dioxygenase [Bisporella sp. PMI_857]
MAAPSADIDAVGSSELPLETIPAGKAAPSQGQYPTPLVYSGTLNEYKHFDVTAVIGREFPEVQLSEILKEDAKIRDLAITISQRGVVFFRNQDLTTHGLKTLAQKLGLLSGKPRDSGLYRHPLSNYKQNFAIDEHGAQDDEISLISSEQRRGWNKERYGYPKVFASSGFHTDFPFENHPTDYGVFKVVGAPEDVGGDTIWASGYEAYDRLSPVLKKFAETLTATHRQEGFHKQAKKGGFKLVQGPRGHPANSSIITLTIRGPLVRTNPVTGWKSLFSSVQHGRINGVSDRENEIFKAYFNQLFFENHDLQVRNRWGQDDVAIWDDRVVIHAATNDYFGKRTAYRVSSVGERPFFNPDSISRRQALGQEYDD